MSRAEGRTPARIEWQDETKPWTSHSSDWHGSRVPVAGDYIDLPGNGVQKVKMVIWSLDGTCVVRMEYHANLAGGPK